MVAKKKAVDINYFLSNTVCDLLATSRHKRRY